MNPKNPTSKDNVNNQIKQHKKSGGNKKSNKKQNQRKNNVHSRHKSGSNQLQNQQVLFSFYCFFATLI